MTTLTERAVQAANERDEELEAKTKAERKARDEEFKAVTETVAKAASAILESNVAPNTLKHEEQTWEIERLKARADELKHYRDMMGENAESQRRRAQKAERERDSIEALLVRVQKVARTKALRERDDAQSAALRLPEQEGRAEEAEQRAEKAEQERDDARLKAGDRAVEIDLAESARQKAEQRASKLEGLVRDTIAEFRERAVEPGLTTAIQGTWRHAAFRLAGARDALQAQHSQDSKSSPDKGSGAVAEGQDSQSGQHSPEEGHDCDNGWLRIGDRSWIACTTQVQRLHDQIGDLAAKLSMAEESLEGDAAVEAAALMRAAQESSGRYAPQSLEEAYPDEKVRACARGSARIILRAALSAAFPDHPQPAPGGEDGDWPEVWLVRSAYTLDPEHYDVWGSAANDTVPHPNEPGEFRRYIPAPDSGEGER